MMEIEWAKRDGATLSVVCDEDGNVACGVVRCISGRVVASMHGADGDVVECEAGAEVDVPAARGAMLEGSAARGWFAVGFDVYLNDADEHARRFTG